MTEHSVHIELVRNYGAFPEFRHACDLSVCSPRRTVRPGRAERQEGC
ncbi:hypothetical protein [Komagataeibacter sp. FNDCF1]|nr:hypothetical protein [Komagataeibacter sp. FNDCF1]MCE2563431.1 hypothetical protein [Komagataeibacter sp. FNDCF1]